MSWELIRDVGLTIFIVGGFFLLFAVTFARHLDPPQTSEKVRALVDRWATSLGDKLMIAGAGLALPGMAAADFIQTHKTSSSETVALRSTINQSPQ